MKYRDYHKLAIIRREARGNTTSIPSKKIYKRKPKHKKCLKSSN
jgi:hypothetical protein